MNTKKNSLLQAGFTLIEVMVAIAIVGILAAIALHLYLRFEDKARMADVISDWQSINTALTAYAASEAASANLSCHEVTQILPKTAFDNSYVNLAVDFYRPNISQTIPVLNICATSAKPRSFQVAQLTHDYFSNMVKVLPGEIIKTSVISFSVPLLGEAFCTGPAPLVQSSCGALSPPVATNTPVPQAPQAQTALPATTQNQQQTAPPVQKPNTPQPLLCQTNEERVQVPIAGGTQEVCLPRCGNNQLRDPANPRRCVAASPSCPPGRELVTIHHGHNYSQICAPVCPPGTRRNPGNQTKCIPNHGH